VSINSDQDQLTAARRNYVGVRCVPISAPYTARFSVSYGEIRRSDSINQRRECAAAFNLIFRAPAFIALHLYLENVDKPHNKQMQSDAAKAAPLIWVISQRRKTGIAKSVALCRFEFMLSLCPIDTSD
jgi:hypothetical protein